MAAAQVMLQLSSADSLPVQVVLNILGNKVDSTIESKDGQSTVVVEGTTYLGIHQITRHLARLVPSSRLYGSSPASASAVDFWMDFARLKFAKAEMAKVGEAFEVMNNHLRMRSFLVDYQITIADVVAFDALRANPAWTKNMKSGSALSQVPHILRWFTFMEETDAVQGALASAKGSANKGGAKKDQASYDIDLPGAVMGKVVTRFPPEPSGYLHIGHAKAALLNEFYARQYQGKLIVRFDDTNPSKEKEEFEHAIVEDLEMLQIKADVITHTSDYFEDLMQFAFKLINSGDAYVDDTPQEQMRKERMDGIASKNRNNSIEENLKRFDAMIRATEIGKTCCLRAKMSVDAKNKALRDPVIYRCNLIPHARSGDKYKVYPTYDFACPIVDSVEGVTHALRTNEYHDRNDQYYWFIEKLGIRKPHIWDYSRMNFVYTLLSKRKLNWFVDTKRVEGWDDPRFPTIRGILRRGLAVEALKEYIYMQGPSKNILLLEWDKLWAVNRKVLDPIAPRYTAINSDNKVKVRLTGGPAKPDAKEVPKHKKNPDLGNKLTIYSSEVFIEGEDAALIEDNEEVTLMDWGNIIVTKISKANGKVSEIEAKLHLEGDFKKTQKKLTWLADTENVIPIALCDFDFLITKKKIEEDDSFEDFLNPNTEMTVSAIGDGNLASLKKGARIQLERKGFYICDTPYHKGSPLKLIAIPDGKKTLTGVSAQETEAPQPKKAIAAASSPAASSPAAHPSSATVHTDSPMYQIRPIYDFNVDIDPRSVTDMYYSKPLYEDAILGTHTPAAPVAQQKAKETPKETPKEAPKQEAKEAPKAQEQPQKGKGGSSAQEGKEGKGGKGGKGGSSSSSSSSVVVAAAAEAEESGHPMAKIDIRIGRILSVKKHHDAETLYVEEVDVGEEKPRTVVSGLVNFLKPEEIQDKLVALVCNLKPANMRGVTSAAMVLAASNAEHTKVELLVPPVGAKPGDRVFVKGYEGSTYEILAPKKKMWEKVQPELHTDGQCVAAFMGIPLQTALGVLSVPSIAGGNIK